MYIVTTFSYIILISMLFFSQASVWRVYILHIHFFFPFIVLPYHVPGSVSLLVAPWYWNSWLPVTSYYVMRPLEFDTSITISDSWNHFLLWLFLFHFPFNGLWLHYSYVLLSIVFMILVQHLIACESGTPKPTSTTQILGFMSWSVVWQYSWGDVSKCLLNPNRELINKTKVGIVLKFNWENHWVLLGFVTGIWVMSYLQEQKWLQDSRITSMRGSSEGAGDLQHTIHASRSTSWRVSFPAPLRLTEAQFTWERLSAVLAAYRCLRWAASSVSS